MLALGSCASLPEKPDLPAESAFQPAASGVIAAADVAFDRRAGDGRSGFKLLERNDEALLWRLALVDHATTSIDAQYFIWQDDEVGGLLLERLIEAADRGVRIRLLVDDFGVAGNADKGIAAISSHPNFEIRLFNPTAVRRGTLGPLFEFVAYFKELNRRMHNKLFVADNRMAIVGGRNIGNPYFGLSEHYNFRDLDVLVAGPVVPEVSDAFDEFWNSEPAYPGRLLDKDLPPETLAELRQKAGEEWLRDKEFLAGTPYPLTRHDWSEEFAALPAQMHLGTARFIQDEPVVGDGEQRRLVDSFSFTDEGLERELLVVSPYLIPVGDMIENIRRREARGIDVRILTASLASNNHTMAHAHYKKYRRPLLETGAEIFEFKGWPSEEVRGYSDVPPVEADFISLHIKTIVADRERAFVGSLNLDPRALVINTENGLLIDSPGLAGQIADMFDVKASPANAWKIVKDPKGRLRWRSGKIDRGSPPARSLGQRVADFFWRLVPIESQI